MLQGEIKKKTNFKKDQSLLALTFETLNHDYETEINRNRRQAQNTKKQDSQ
jgi:hypothetical protein